jgi:hypothetical protein
MGGGGDAPSGSNPTTARRRPVGSLPSPAAQETGASCTRAGPRAAARTASPAAQGLSWHAPWPDMGGAVDMAGQGRAPDESARATPQKSPSVGVLARTAAAGGAACVWASRRVPVRGSLAAHDELILRSPAWGAGSRGARRCRPLSPRRAPAGSPSRVMWLKTRFQAPRPQEPS